MDKLSALAAFAQVARMGSFTEAGSNLSRGPSAVTKKIAALEEWLGVRLLQRTTHGVSLTDDGAICLDIVHGILQGVDELEQVVASRRSAPTGQVRIALPLAMSQIYLAPVLPEFLANNPALSLDFQYCDESADLLAQRLDICVRVGEPRDSRVVARLLARQRRVTCASAAYLQKNGTPMSPDDVQHHNCVTIQVEGKPRPWRFSGGDEETTLVPKGNLTVHSGVALREAALAGVGLIQANSILVSTDLLAGRLLPVLTDYSVPAVSIFAVFQQNRQMVPRVRVVIELLEKIFAPYREPVAACLPSAARLAKDAAPDAA